MKTSELLKKLAQTLTNPDNEIFQAADENPEVLSTVANVLTEAAEQINLAAEEVATKEEAINSDGVEIMAALATACDETDDPELHKLASVLDEILLTIGTPKSAVVSLKQADDKEVARLREKYRAESLEAAYGNATKEHAKQNDVEESAKQIQSKVKKYRPMQHSLSTRYSPDMPGVSLMRIGDNVYQCPVTKKIYNWESGFTTMDGDKIPGSSVTNQTQQLGDQIPEHMNYSTREEILNG